MSMRWMWRVMVGFCLIAAPAAAQPAANPHAGQAGTPRRQPDRLIPSEELPAGVVDVLVANADDRPIPNAPVELVIVRNSVTKGESRSIQKTTANQGGRALFEKLDVGTGISYRVTSSRGEAVFSSAPFGLRDRKGMKVLLHTFEPTSDLAASKLLMEAYVALDIKEDRLSVNHLFRILNLGRTAYVAKGLTLPLPPDFQAFNAMESDGIGMEEREGVAHFEGTYPPGQAEIRFSYQVPLKDGASQRFQLPLPPRVAHTTVTTSAGPTMTLQIAGFPAAERGRRRDGQRVLETSKRAAITADIPAFLANVAGGQLDVTLGGLPTPGPGRWIALALLVIAVALGVNFFVEQRRSRQVGLREDERVDLEEAREKLLDELTLLERARLDSKVGPRSYERLRAALMDALARIVSRLEPAADGPVSEPPSPAQP